MREREREREREIETEREREFVCVVWSVTGPRQCGDGAHAVLA